MTYNKKLNLNNKTDKTDARRNPIVRVWKLFDSYRADYLRNILSDKSCGDVSLRWPDQAEHILVQRGGGFFRPRQQLSMCGHCGVSDDDRYCAAYCYRSCCELQEVYC